MHSSVNHPRQSMQQQQHNQDRVSADLTPTLEGREGCFRQTLSSSETITKQLEKQKQQD